MLPRICQRYSSYAHILEWEAHAWVFRCLCFTFVRGVAELFVDRQFVDLSSSFSCSNDTFYWLLVFWHDAQALVPGPLL